MGFFSKKELRDLSNVGRRDQYLINNNCAKCGLYKKCNSPKMQPQGKGEILIVIGKVGAVEDKQGGYLKGKSGKLLQQFLKRNKITDYMVTSAMRCYQAEYTTQQIKSCRRKVQDLIKIMKPKLVLLFGEQAYKSVIGMDFSGRIKGIEFRDMVGTVIPDQRYNCYIAVLDSPHQLIDDDRKFINRWYLEKLKKALLWVDKNFKMCYYDKVSILNEDETIKKLGDWQSGYYSFDYETTGIKPHRKGQKIKTCAISDGNRSYSFLVTEKVKHHLKEFLKRVNLIAHNMHYERLWSKVLLDVFPNIVWDTMLAAKCLHNQRPVSLKFQTYLEFGVLGYDSDIDEFITKTKDFDDEKSGNRFNRIDEADINDLLYYNGLDSLFTFWLWEIQKQQITGHQLEGLYLFQEGVKSLVDCQLNGFRVNGLELEKSKKFLSGKMEHYLNEIKNSKELKLWDKEEEFNHTSAPDLSYLFYDKLKLAVTKETKTGKPSTDKDVLSKFDSSLAKNILEYKKWKKGHDYVLGYEREVVNGKIHPFTNLARTQTYRSSANDINYQNQEKHNKVMREITRKLIIPENRNYIFEYDYKANEVAASCCYHKDPLLMQYVIDRFDFHSIYAKKIFIRDELENNERFLGKNLFVFAQFYGDWYGAIAENLWQDMGEESKQHLYNQGIKTLDDLTEHIRIIEEVMWNDFHVYKEWKDKFYFDFLKKGYCESLTGFRFYEPLTKNQVVNAPIQGTAFHWTLWTLIQLYKNWKFPKSILTGEIHDSILGNGHPDDEKEIDYMVWDFGTQKIREHWDWINVPMFIEKSKGEIDGNWNEMKDMGYLEYDKV